MYQTLTGSAVNDTNAEDNLFTSRITSLKLGLLCGREVFLFIELISGLEPHEQPLYCYKLITPVHNNVLYTGNIVNDYSGNSPSLSSVTDSTTSLTG